MPYDPFRTELRRERLIWHWSLTFTHPDGNIELISFGHALRKRKARAAAQSWQRIVMRRRGLIT
jgi:hypothetical protein